MTELWWIVLLAVGCVISFGVGYIRGAVDATDRCAKRVAELMHNMRKPLP